MVYIVMCYIVMWNVVGDRLQEKVEVIVVICCEFEVFKGFILGMLYFEIGIDMSWIVYVCDIVFVMDFESLVVLEVYVVYFVYLVVCDWLEGLCIVWYQVDYLVVIERVV